MTKSKARYVFRSFLLAFFVIGLFFVGSSFGGSPKVSACPTCFSESATAYVYCRDVGGYYNGCNFQIPCGVGTQSANQIYHDNCLLAH